MIIEALLIAWFITHFEPIQNLIMKSNIKFLIDVFTCFKCTSFWVTLVFTLVTMQFTIYPAIMNSVIAYVYSRIDNQFPTKLN